MASHSPRANLAPSLIRLGARVLAAVSLVALLLVALWLWLSWENTRRAAEHTLAMSAALVAAHAESQFEALALELARLAVDLDRAPRSGEGFWLESIRERHPDLMALGLRRPADGRPLAMALRARGSFTQPAVPADPAWREDFLSALQARSRPFIARPYLHPAAGQWVLPMYYPVRRAGRVVYVLEAAIALADQQSLWRELAQGRTMAIGLLREDGYLVSRLPQGSPEKIYRQRNLQGALYLASRSGARTGTYAGTVADGSYRYGAYQRLERYPLIAFVSEARSALIAAWWQQVHMPLYLIFGVLIGATLLYVVLARRYAARMNTIERALAAPSGQDLPRLPSSGVREIDTLVASLSEVRERLREATRQRERLLAAAAAAATYTVRESDGIVTAVNDVFTRLTGFEASAVVGRPWRECLYDPAEDQPALPGFESPPRVLRLKGADGRPRWVSVAEYREVLDGGIAMRHGLAIDVTERERLLETVRRQSQRFATLWQLATGRGLDEPERIALTLRMALEMLEMEVALVAEREEDRLVLRAVEDPSARFARGQTFELSDTLFTRSLRARASLFIADLAAEAAWRDHPIHAEFGFRTYVSIPIFAGERLYGTLIFMRRAPTSGGFETDDRNFIELLAAWFGQLLLEQTRREELERLALTDALTSLPNRRAAEQRLAQEYARARREGVPFAVAIADLDGFKLVNDHYGHEIGDEVLRAVAAFLQAQLREGDWVARWGGEEFLIFLHQAEAAVATQVMERLRQRLRAQGFATRAGTFSLTVSIGIGVWRQGEALSSVLAEADGCLYEAKHAGRDRVVASEVSRRGTLWRAGQLQQALREGRLVAAYQTIVDLKTGTPVADEALARLVTPDGQVVPARDFIEAAEGTHLVHLVDRAISLQALERCAASRRCGATREGFAHFINLSPQFLARRELVEQLLERARQHCAGLGVSAAEVKPLVFEITEREFVRDFEELRRNLEPLLEFGFRLALDDFGSGYSSFLYLCHLPIAFVKIEGWMVQRMRADTRVRALVSAIANMARDQGIVTIAECVEDAATAELARALGVDWAQGYYFGTPQCEAPSAEPVLVVDSRGSAP